MIAAGDLFKFNILSRHYRLTRNLNERTGLYLGEVPLRRSDGVVIKNHSILLIGDSCPVLIDSGLLKYMIVLQTI